MPLNSNRAIIACAGSGKTTFVVQKAIKQTSGRVLITTYTNENIDQIKDCLIEHNGYIPENIEIMQWSTFLLQEGVRPYQNQLSNTPRVRSIYFQTGASVFLRKDQYFTSSNDIYSNKLSEFVYECNQKSGGLVTKRLEKIYSHIFIDELQDFAGYDLNVVENLFSSGMQIVVVGDPRQATFSTNYAAKNKQFRRSKIIDWLKEQTTKQSLTIKNLQVSYRCNKPICDFANKLFPHYSESTSENKSDTEHDGLFLVSNKEIDEYIKKYHPKILRYDKRTKTGGYPAINIGISKGRTFDRILIFPTGKMLTYLKTGNLSLAGDITKFYIAVTRARHSVAFVVPPSTRSEMIQWWESEHSERCENSTETNKN